MSVNLKEQKKTAMLIFCCLGFFIFGISTNDSMEDQTLIAKQTVKAPSRGIASE